MALADEEYFTTARRLRELAMQKYGCVDFVSTTEGNKEIAISYWPDITHIKNWKNDPEHLSAQKKGRDTWYKTYRVDICKIERSYENST